MSLPTLCRSSKRLPGGHNALVNARRIHSRKSIPTAAERFAERDEIRVGARLALFQVALAVQKLLLHVRHVEIVKCPRLVALPRDRQCTLVQGNHRSQRITAPLLGIVDNKCIVHLVPGF